MKMKQNLYVVVVSVDYHLPYISPLSTTLTLTCIIPPPNTRYNCLPVFTSLFPFFLLYICILSNDHTHKLN
jgi:hypothetical protein